MQAPHDTQSDSRKLSSWPATTLDAKPLPSIVSANVPSISSCAHAARADDAFGGIEGEIRVALVLVGDEVVEALIAIADVAQAHRAGLVLQFAIAIGRASETIERMVGDVELHHPAAQLGQPVGLRPHDHAVRDRRGARRRIAVAAIDLDQAEAARAESLERVGCAQFGNSRAEQRRGAHDRRPLGHRQILPVDPERHHRRRRRRNRLGAEILLADPCHGRYSAAAEEMGAAAPKSCGKWSSALSTG